MLGGGRDSAAVFGIENDEVRVAADGDGAFAGEQAEELGGARAGGVDETMEVQRASPHAVGIQQAHPFLNAGNAVGDLSERLGAKQFLGGVEGAMVRSDGVDETGGERVPQNLLIAAIAQWRRHDVLHAFHTGALGVGLIEQEMGQDGFDPQARAAGLRGKRRLQRALRGEVHDIAGGPGVLEKGAEAVGAFGFHGFGAAGFMPLRPRLALGQQTLLQAADELGVFAVGGDDDPQFLRQPQGLVHLAIVHTEKVLVSEEDLERSDTVGDDLAQLPFGLRFESRHRHVEGVVAGAGACRLALPKLIALDRVIEARRAAHFDISGGAAHQRGDAAGFVGVLREGGHEGQIEMHMRVNKAGEDEVARGIDDLGAGGRVEVGAEASDGLVFDIDVGVRTAVGGDDVGVTNQEWH